MSEDRYRVPEPDEFLLGTAPRNPEAEAKAEKKSREEQDLRRRYLEARMREPLFREWLMGWLIRFGTFENIFAAGPTGFPDERATWFRQGLKAAGWDLWESIDNTDPAMASLMRREQAGKI